MPSCIFKHCKSCSQKQKKEDGISFHRLPTDVVLRDEWVTIIRQSRQDNYWLPSKFCVVCSLHFKEDDYYFTEKGRRLIKKTSKPTQNLCKLPTTPETSSVDAGSTIALEDQADSLNLLELHQLPGKLKTGNSVEPEKPTQNSCASPPLIKEESSFAEGLMNTIVLEDQADPLNLLEVHQLPGNLKTEKSVEPDKPTQNLCASWQLIKEESSVGLGLMNTTALEYQADPLNLLVVNQFPGKLITDTSVVPEKPTQNLSVSPPLIKEESSDSEGSMSTLASVDQAGPSNLLEVNELPGKCIKGNSVEPELSDSDNSIFDTPTKYKLRKDLRKHKLLRVTMKRKIKALQQKNRRLEKRNAALKNIIKDLLQQSKSRRQSGVEAARH